LSDTLNASGGQHWVQFEFDQAYLMGDMWLWNTHDKSTVDTWRFGMKDIDSNLSFGLTSAGRMSHLGKVGFLFVPQQEL